MEKFDTALVEIVDKLTTLTEKHGPQAVDLALWVYQLDALRYVISTSVLVIFMISVSAWGVRNFKKELKNRCNEDWLATWGAISTLGIIFSAIVTIILIDPIYWAAAFGYPELLIAQNVLEAAGLK